MDIIQEAKTISAEFKEIEAEYNSPDSLIDMGNWYYISKKQDEIISRLVDRLEWQNMDSAPKDGTEILGVYIYNSTIDYAIIKYWDKASDWYCVADGSIVIESQGDFGTDYKSFFPHKWLPLPPAEINNMDIIQEAKEYIANHKLPETTNHGLDLISKLLDRLEKLESLCIKAEMGLTDIYAYDIRAILGKCE